VLGGKKGRGLNAPSRQIEAKRTTEITSTLYWRRSEEGEASAAKTPLLGLGNERKAKGNIQEDQGVKNVTCERKLERDLAEKCPAPNSSGPSGNFWLAQEGNQGKCWGLLVKGNLCLVHGKVGGIA